MTLKEWLFRYLDSYMIRGDDAQAIFVSAIINPGLKVFARYWDESIEGFPKELHAVLGVSTIAVIIEWAELNKPDAWYLPSLKKKAEPPRSPCRGITAR